MSNFLKLSERFLKLSEDRQKRFVITIIFNLIIARYPENGEKNLDEQLKIYEEGENKWIMLL